MRVLHVINSLAIGGAERLVSSLVERLGEAGVDSEILVLKRARRELEFKGSLKSLNSSSVYSPLNVLKIRDFLRGYDLIHVHLFPAFYWVHFALRGDEIPLVLTEHGTDNRRRRIGALRGIERRVYGRYKRIIAISESVRESLLKWLGEDFSERIEVVRNGVDIDGIRRSDPEILDVPFDVKIVMVGRFAHQKDQLTLVKSLEYLPKNVGALLIGGGKLLRKVERKVKELSLEGRVVFLGETLNVYRILKGSDVYVHSVLSEGFGLSVVEAMAAGLPVVVSDIESLREVVGDSGLYFKRGDPRSLARALKRLLSDEKTRMEYSKRSHSRAEMFDISKTLEGYMKIYKEVIR